MRQIHDLQNICPYHGLHLVNNLSMPVNQDVGVGHAPGHEKSRCEQAHPFMCLETIGKLFNPWVERLGLFS